MRGLLPMPPIQSRTSSSRAGATGPGEKPHMPTTSVVTPCRTLDSADGQVSSTRSECEWMSMKPGATISPAASMVRAASPRRPGPTATMRSPSTATSAATAGAPRAVDDPAVPDEERPGHYCGGLDDLHRLHLVADLDAVHHLHPGGDDAEHRVVAVEEGRGLEADVELAARGVGALRARHGHRAADVLLLVELGLDLVAGPAGAVALRIAALGDEARLHAVEGEAVVEALLGEGDEVLDRLGRVGGIEVDLDLAALVHRDDR